MKAKVVYIVGTGYSGSTFLAALLGAHPEIEPVSEIGRWSRSRDERSEPARNCACGLLRVECPYWRDVHQRWLERLAPVTEAENDRLHAELERTSPLAGREPPASPERRALYAHAAVALFASVADVSGRRVVVDGTKSLPRARALLAVETLETSVLHLVRNGLNYLDSSLRRGNRVQLDDRFPAFRSFRLGVRWARRNRAAERLAASSRERGLTLRYEDLVSDPASSLHAVGRALGMEMAPVVDHVLAARPVDYRHMASGSGHRLRDAQPLSTEYRAVPPIDRRRRLAFQLGAGRTLRRYGYL